MPGMMKKAAPARKPTPKPTATKKATPTAKPKNVPVPKFTAPSVAQFRKSAAYITNSMGYKEYVDEMYEVYRAKLKKGR
jgi:hypothetical protein